jgi:predicted small metal-binding protein
MRVSTASVSCSGLVQNCSYEAVLPVSSRLGSWGAKAENADELERLIVEAIRDQAFWRRNFYPSDPTHISLADPSPLAVAALI